MSNLENRICEQRSNPTDDRVNNEPLCRVEPDTELAIFGVATTYTSQQIRATTMSSPRNRRRLFFFRGMGSAFRLHPNRFFVEWLEDHSRNSDVDRMRQDVEMVGSDMRRVIDQHVEQLTVK